MDRSYPNKIFLILLCWVISISAQAAICDVDDDGDVDRNDISLIFDARNTPASGPDDPRDADGNGTINVLDNRQCVLQCTLANCEIIDNTPTLVPSGPIVINGEHDVVISGLHITNPTGACIRVTNNSSNIVIENSEIGPCGAQGIHIVSGSNHVTVRNNYIHDTEQNGVGTYEAHHIAVDRNVFINVWSGAKFWTTSEGYLTFTNNFVKNIGAKYDHSFGPSRSSNVVMAVFAHGPGIRFTDNVAINEPGKSSTEDLVNLWNSGGTASDPILIARNKFNGGGPSISGFGLQLGDEGAHHAVAEDNILVNPGSGGIGVHGSGGITIRNNKVFSANDPERPFTNVGMVVAVPGDGGCRTDTTIENNEITFWQAADFRGSGSTAPFLASYWMKSTGCDDIAGWSTNKFDMPKAQSANLDSSLWDPAWNTPSFLPDNPYFYNDSVQ